MRTEGRPQGSFRDKLMGWYATEEQDGGEDKFLEEEE